MTLWFASALLLDVELAFDRHSPARQGGPPHLRERLGQAVGRPLPRP